VAGFVLWFTGLSGSGKSTLTTLVAAELRQRGVHVETLDGDEIRKNLSKGLGFSKEDRDANIRRLGFVARLISRSGACAITAAISPYREVRDEVRRGVARFCEVYCECPLSVLAKRDPKGLYEKAMRGELKNFTGVDDPYEAPLEPEVHLRTDQEQPQVSAARIVERLVELGFLEAARSEEHTLVSPYSGELETRLAPVSDTSQGVLTSRVDLDRDAELAVVGFALGLLSPMRGFMGSRDAFKVRGEQHLESGAPWPHPIILKGGPVASNARVALCSGSTLLGWLQVAESWAARDDEEHCLGGDVTVERLPAWAGACRSVQVCRDELRGRGSSVALPLLDFPSLGDGDDHVARAALELNQHLLLLPVLRPEADARLLAGTAALVERYLDSARVSVVPIPLPPGGSGTLPGFLTIYAQNLGAAKLLLPERLLDSELHAGSRAVLNSAAREIAVEGYVEPFFDERLGGQPGRPYLVMRTLPR
jgi:adenylyl-sulfate kinase